MALTRSMSEDVRSNFWNTIFSILGPFDLYGATGSDPLQRSRRDLVVQIFRLVDYPENLEVSVAALHAIADMADSPVFAAATPHSTHKLYSILEAAGELPSIMEALVRRLEREETEHVSLISGDGKGWHERANDEEGFIASFGLSNLVRLQIVDFLIRNVSKPGYNLAHYLLGFHPSLTTCAATLLLPSSQEGVQFSCLHLVLELLAFGLGHPSTSIVALDHPSFGLKCYELLVALLSNPRTSRATANYLRDQEDFFRKQLAFVAREPVDLTDIGYTILEMQQKAALLKGAMLDLHTSMAEGAWSYARKLSMVLARGTIGEKESSEAILDAGQSLVSVMMSSVESVLSSEYLSTLPSVVQDQIVSAAGSLVRATAKISQLVLASLDRIPYDRQAILSIQSHLVTSIVPVIGRLQANQSADYVILENCAALSVAIASGFFRRVDSAELTVLSGDEVSALASGAIRGILRPDSNLPCRGYLYSVICEASYLMSQDPSSLSSLKSLLSKEHVRLIEIAAVDSVVPAVDADGWKTMATTFLRDIICLTPDVSPIDRLVRIGYIKNLVASVRIDDNTMISVINPSCQTLNSLFLWRSRFALLQKLASEPLGGERLLEAGLIDTIVGLRVLDWHRTVDSQEFTSTNASLAEHRWHLVLLPLARLLLILSTDSTGVIFNSVSALVANRSMVFESLVRFKSQFPSNDEHLELVSLVSQLLAQTVSSQNRLARLSILSHLLTRTISSSTEREWSEPASSIVNTCVRLMATCISADQTVQILNFNNESMDGASRSTMIPLGLLIAVLDGAIAMVKSSASKVHLMTIEAVLLILLLSIERHSPADSMQKEVDIRHLSAAASPLFELLQPLTAKDKDSYLLIASLLKDLRRLTVRSGDCARLILVKTPLQRVMFDNLSCLIDAVNVLDSPSTSRTLGPEPRQERLASISSVASLCSLSGSTSPSVSPYLMPRTKVPRKRISPEQTCALQSLFDSGVHFPTRDMRERLARQLTLTSRTIQVWFQNRRQAARNRARGVDRPPPGQKLSIRWMKPVVFYTDSSHILDKERLWRPATPIETVVHSPESTADYT